MIGSLLNTISVGLENVWNLVYVDEGLQFPIRELGFVLKSFLNMEYEWTLVGRLINEFLEMKVCYAVRICIPGLCYDCSLLCVSSPVDPDLNRNAIDYRDNHKYRDVITVN